MPKVTISTENVVMTALSAGMLFNCQRLEYLPEYFVQHLLVYLSLLILSLLRYIEVHDWNRQKSEHYDAVRCGHLADLRR